MPSPKCKFILFFFFVCLNIEMISNEIEKLLSDLSLTNQNLMELMKNETDIKKLKDLERDVQKTSLLIRTILQYTNYFKMKEIKNKNI